MPKPDEVDLARRLRRPASKVWAAGDVDVLLIAVDESAPAPPDGLTEAESEVFGLLVDGKSAAEIAQARSSSLKTVHGQIESVYRKLNVQSRFELCSRARSLVSEGD